MTGSLQYFESFVFQSFCSTFSAALGIVFLFGPSFSCQRDGIQRSSLSDSKTLRPCDYTASPSMLCLIFTKRGALHYYQTYPLWSNLAKGHYFRSHVVCSDAVLPFSSEDAVSWQPFSPFCSFSDAQSDFRVNFLGHSLLERMETIFSVFQLRIIVLTAE